MRFEILDPTHEASAVAFRPAERLPTLAGTTIALVSNGKKGVRTFFDALESTLVSDFDVATVVRLTKSNYSAPAEEALFSRSDEWNALVAGVGD